MILLIIYDLLRIDGVCRDHSPPQRFMRFKDVEGCQFLTIAAAEPLCMVCLPPGEHIS